MALGIATYSFAVATTKETRHILRTINKTAHLNKSKTIKLKKLFDEFIEAHGIAIQLSILSNVQHNWICVASFIFYAQHLDLFRVEHSNSEIFQPIFMSLFTWSLFAISSAMLIVQVEIVEYCLAPSKIAQMFLNFRITNAFSCTMEMSCLC